MGYMLGIRLAACAALAALGGCGNLLPRGSSETLSSFGSFEAARDALSRVVPYETTTQQLSELGFDLKDSVNVQLIPYPEVVARLAPNPSISLEQLDAGIRDCILARQACRAYIFSMGEQRRRREGGILLDFLNFHRKTAITGWRFEGLVVVRNGVVLFTNYGGEPQIERSERQSNPLGPLQPAGEAAGSLFVR
ncbi:MAG: hypothetical protein V4532_18235 [Pseudomonadota bacterium]